MERRMAHLQVAIENLHAAGMHLPAQRLEQHAAQMRSGPARERGVAPSGPERPMGELRQLRGELQELREAVGELRRQLEELNRRSRRPGAR